MNETVGIDGISYTHMVSDLTRAMMEHNQYYEMVRQEIVNLMEDEPIVVAPIVTEVKTFKFLK